MIKFSINVDSIKERYELNDGRIKHARLRFNPVPSEYPHITTLPLDHQLRISRVSLADYLKYPNYKIVELIYKDISNRVGNRSHFEVLP